MSTLFRMATSEWRKIWWCFLTMSSPSVTEITTTLRSVPRGKSDGQTRFPTFSMKTTSYLSRSIESSLLWTRLASRWHSFPVLQFTDSRPEASNLL